MFCRIELHDLFVDVIKAYILFLISILHVGKPFIYIRTYTHTYTYIYVHVIDVHMCICVYVHIHIRTHTYAYTYHTICVNT